MKNLLYAALWLALLSGSVFAQEDDSSPNAEMNESDEPKNTEFRPDDAKDAFSDKTAF